MNFCPCVPYLLIDLCETPSRSTRSVIEQLRVFFLLNNRCSDSHSRDVNETLPMLSKIFVQFGQNTAWNIFKVTYRVVVSYMTVGVMRVVPGC